MRRRKVSRRRARASLRGCGPSRDSADGCALAIRTVRVAVKMLDAPSPSGEDASNAHRSRLRFSLLAFEAFSGRRQPVARRRLLRHFLGPSPRGAGSRAVDNATIRRPCRLWFNHSAGAHAAPWRCGFIVLRVGPGGRRLAGWSRWLFPGSKAPIGRDHR